MDFRNGAHGPAVLAAEVLGEDPFSIAVLVFRFRAKRVSNSPDPQRRTAG